MLVWWLAYRSRLSTTEGAFRAGELRHLRDAAARAQTTSLDCAPRNAADRPSEPDNAARPETEMTMDNVIDVKRLRYFVAVCKHGGFSHAANVIGVAQPALTRQIQLLERELGLKLITRNGRGAEPTEEGRFLLARSIEYLDGLDNLFLELKQRSSQMNGQAVVGICPTISSFFLGDLKSYVATNSPDLSMSVVEAYSGDLKNLMNSDRLDLALTYKPSGSVSVQHIEAFFRATRARFRLRPDVPQRSYQAKRARKPKAHSTEPHS